MVSGGVNQLHCVKVKEVVYDADGRVRIIGTGSSKTQEATAGERISVGIELNVKFPGLNRIDGCLVDRERWVPGE